jgi:hypothetical protein
VRRIRILLMSKKIRPYCLVGCIERLYWVKAMFNDLPGYFLHREPHLKGKEPRAQMCRWLYPDI